MAKTRTVEDIYAELRNLRLEEGPDFDRAYAEYLDRQEQLWGDLARLVTRDRATPPWATLAVALLRDEYRRQAQQAWREISA